MLLRNEFIRDFHQRRSDLSTEQREKIQAKMIDDLDSLGIFDSLVFSEPDKFSDYDEEADREAHIRAQQISHGIDPDSIEEMPYEQKQVIKHRHGKNDLHRAVEMGNIEEAHRLIREGWNPLDRDNNGHDCIVIASLEENMAMLAMFREEGVLEVCESEYEEPNDDELGETEQTG